MRRLAEAKRQILAGAGLAQAAYTAGFSDQSHLTRQFRAAFGLSPGQWTRKVRNQQADRAE
jgi:AraC-like DNA-binding protein